MTVYPSSAHESNDDYDRAAAEHLERLDRLVDNELDDAERRELLLELEHSPDGWRQCALAFLEAQAFGDGLRSLMTDPPDADPGRRAGVPPRGEAGPLSPATVHASRLSSMLAVAAGLMLAFSVGVASRGIWSESRDPAASAAMAPDRAPAGASSADTTQRSRAPAETSTVSTIPVPFADRKSGRVERIDIPIVEAKSTQEAALGEAEQIPPQILRMFEQIGPFERTRKYLPVELGDGRSVVVPLGHIELRPRVPEYQ